MPRYDRYRPDAIALLQQAQRLAAATPTCEMTPGLVLQAFLQGDSPLRDQLMTAHSLEVITSGSPGDASDMADEALVKNVALSADLRRDLDEAEATAPGPITARHVLSAIWPESQPLLAGFVRSRTGEPLPIPLALPEETGSPAAESPPPRKKHRTLGGPLGRFGHDFSAAEAAHPIVGRENELNELVETLLKYHKPNAVLLGDAGVGKTAVVEGLANLIRQGKAPPGLADKRIVGLQVNTMVAGTAYRGQFEERVKQLVDQAENDPTIILFIDEIHMLVGAGANRGEHGDASNILKPALARGRIRVIGATTWSEYYASIARDPALERRFQTIRIDEPAPAAVKAILDAALPKMLAFHRLEAAPEIIPLVIDLCSRDLPSRRFPDKAIDVIDLACARAARNGAARIEAAHVRSVVAKLAGITFTSDSPEFEARLAALESALGRNVLRQDDAIRTVSQFVKLCKRRLDLRTHRPDGVFLFVGKSGVGKTELAKSLAESLYGSAENVIRLDMTGYSDSSSVSNLLGSPAGTVHSDEEPAWLEQLKKTPSAVLLLDELEKAHPEVAKVFLRAFDEGEIVDARGNEYSLANVTVIATSNAKVDLDGGGIGFQPSVPDAHRDWIAGLEAYFPAEFLNRFDEIVPFDPLTTADLGIILREKFLPRADAKLVKDCNVRLRVTDAAVRRLAELADSDSFGARELERVFTRNVLMPAIDAAHAAKNVNPSTTGTVLVDRAPDGHLTVALEAAAV